MAKSQAAALAGSRPSIASRLFNCVRATKVDGNNPSEHSEEQDDRPDDGQEDCSLTGTSTTYSALKERGGGAA